MIRRSTENGSAQTTKSAVYREPSRQLTSAFAELGNVASAEGTAGATTAAAFLSRFVRDEGKGWVHLDLAASYQKSGNELWATGAKGHGLRTIARWLQEVSA